MLKFSSTLQAVLNATSNKTAWATTLKEQLGTSVRVRCFRDSNAAANDPATTGTEFLNMGCVGGITVAAGKITSFGTTTNVTTKQAADLATGACVLRIEGNGHWVQGTLGLAGAATDFVMTANPTSGTNVGIAAKLNMSAPPLMASGTGYNPPSLDSNAPAYARIMDWSDPANPVEAGRINFNKRIKNWVFEDAEFAANVGDVRVTQSTDMVKLGTFEVGATLFSNNPAVNTVQGATLHKTIVAFKPENSDWANYPRSSGYRRGTRTMNGASKSYGLSNTFPPPFKVEICKADGFVLFTHQMRDGLPINSPDLGYGATKTKAIRPFFHCGMLLEWSSGKPVMSSKASKYFPGVDSENLRPSLGKEKAAFNKTYPMHSAAQPGNSSGHWYAMPKWALPLSVEAFTADQSSRTDPYLFPIGPSSPEGAAWSSPTWLQTYGGVASADMGTLSYGMACYEGWGYEPGSQGGHDHYNGDGGVRIDRSVMPSPMVIHLTNPNWLHLRDNTLIGEVVEHWNQNYFNHSYHYVTDVKTLSTIPVTEVLAGLWSYSESYYGGNAFYTSSTDYAIPQFCNRANDPSLPYSGAFVDTNYRMPWNGSQYDHLHNWPCPGWVALIYNSVTHAYAQKHRYLSSIMTALGSSATYPNKSATHYFGIRDHAERMLQHAIMWKLASDHPCGISRADVEARIIGELSAVYDTIYKPLYIDNSQTTYYKTLRNLGVSVSFKNGKWYTESWCLHFYMAHALQFWRQSGLFKRMWDYSATTRNALIAIIKNLDTGSFGFLLDTQGAYIGNGGDVFSGNPVLMVGDNTAANPEVPTSYADWQSRVSPKVGQSSIVKDASGAFKVPISDEHLRMQWVFIRRDYFPDIPCSYDITAGCTLVKGWQDEWASRISTLETNGTSKNSIRLSEWMLTPAYGRILPPTSLDTLGV